MSKHQVEAERRDQTLIDERQKRASVSNAPALEAPSVEEAMTAEPASQDAAE